jgi:hypothetical protein
MWESRDDIIIIIIIIISNLCDKILHWNKRKEKKRKGCTLPLIIVLGEL